ncbi:phosphomannomutase, partial [Candidatus Dojkabacteria bacterium]|nr:phosphomannomutase [Candidatus Dojkabacteria bacterium]
MDNLNFFKGYDVRGLVNSELNNEVLFKLGIAFSIYLKQKNINECIVGRDGRESSESYQTSFIKGLTQNGINVIDIGLVITP